jgi:hypothetical protein
VTHPGLPAEKACRERDVTPPISSIARVRRRRASAGFYVALTRPTKTLIVVIARPLPDVLAGYTR